MNPAKHHDSLFRKEALNNLFADEDINTSLTILTLGAWLWLLIVLIMLAAIIIWCIFGRLNLYVTAPGVLMSTHTIMQSEKKVKECLYDKKNKMLSLGQLLEHMKHLYQAHYLTVLEFNQMKEKYVFARSDYLSYLIRINQLSNLMINNDNKTKLAVVVFIPYLEAKKVLLGLDALIILDSSSSYHNDYIKGKVIRISSYPITKEIANIYLNNSSLVDNFFSQGPIFMAIIQLQQNTNFSFSSHLGSFVMTKIIYQRISPLKLLFSR